MKGTKERVVYFQAIYLVKLLQKKAKKLSELETMMENDSRIQCDSANTRKSLVTT